MVLLLIRFVHKLYFSFSLTLTWLISLQDVNHIMLIQTEKSIDLIASYIILVYNVSFGDLDLKILMLPMKQVV